MFEQRGVQEIIETMRRDIVMLLSRDPHCRVANLLGSALMDLYAEHYS